MKWKLYLKLLLTAIVVGFIARSIDLPTVISAIVNLPLYASVFVILGYAASQILSAWKWQLLAKAGGLSVTPLEAVKAYFIGMFVNCFGLGMVGGDVVRGVLVSGESGSRTLGVTSVVADRAHGLAILAAIGGGSALLFKPDFLDTYLIWVLVCTGFGVGFGWIVAPTLVKLLFSAESNLGKKFIALSLMLTRDAKILMAITVLSFLVHILQLSLHLLMAYALGVPVPFWYILTAVPFINIAGSLPISWNGVGVREVGYIFFFTQQHHFMSQEQAVVMGSLWLLASTSSSAVGGALAFLSKDFRALFPIKKLGKGPIMQS